MRTVEAAREQHYFIVES